MKHNEHIKNELLIISKDVNHFNLSNPYRVPEGYFYYLSDNIMSAIRQKDHLETAPADEIQLLSPFIAALKNKSTYTVREDYFAGKVHDLSKVADLQRLKHIRSNRPAYIPRLAIAASLIAIIGIASLLFNLFVKDHTDLHTSEKPITEEQLKVELANIEPDQIVAYLEEYNLPEDRNTMEMMIETTQLPNEAEYFDETLIKELWYDNQEIKMN